jgi:formate hydrogenlyase subunit 3/multisubunit Na+/H+ antiporter MnhD subunit
MGTIHPAVIFFVGAALIPLFKGKARGVFAVGVALAAFIYMLFLEPQRGWSFYVLGFNVVLLSVDKLSLFTGYIFILTGLLIILYSIHVKEFVSKAVIHKAADYYDVLYWMPKLASVGTFLAFCKFMYFEFLRKKEIVAREASPHNSDTHNCFGAGGHTLWHIYGYTPINGGDGGQVVVRKVKR